MLDGLFIASLIGTCVQLVKESLEKPIPAENWANKELYHEDLVNGVSIEQRMKNLKNGRYKLVEQYPEPHRDSNGKIIIENNLLYKQDLLKYGGAQTMKWVKQGKYNLTPEELEKEHKRIKKEIEELCKLR